MKKIYLIVICILILIIGWLFVRFIIGGDEDNWIKDERGIYVKHGNPFETPIYVTEQQDAVSCALGLYDTEKNKGSEFNSQCLGTCGDYAIEIVHVPRTNEDNLVENQCSDFRESKVSKFIELGADGNIVRIM